MTLLIDVRLCFFFKKAHYVFLACLCCCCWQTRMKCFPLYISELSDCIILVVKVVFLLKQSSLMLIVSTSEPVV